MDESKLQEPAKYSGNEIKYVIEQLYYDQFRTSNPPFTWRLERAFADRFNVRYAIALNSGTSALHSCLAAAGVGPGDEVISPALTVIMDSYATIHMGATPVFADVDAGTQNIDPVDVQKKITRKTKAIITVSLQGLPADVARIMRIAEEHNLIVVEDCAQTMLGKYDCTTKCPGCERVCRGRYSGAVGHLGIFSFETKKHVSTGEGGMVVTNDSSLAEKVRKFGGIGYKVLTADGSVRGLPRALLQDPDYERFDSLGLNYRMPELCAAVGLAQFERVEELVTRRQRIGKLYAEAVEGCSWLVPQAVPDGFEHTYYTYAVRYYGEKVVGLSWREFYKQYIAHGGDGFYGACKVPYLEPVFEKLMFDGRRYGKGLCPIAEEIQPRVMQFKTDHRNLALAEAQARILKQLIDKLGRNHV